MANASFSAQPGTFVNQQPDIMPRLDLNASPKMSNKYKVGYSGRASPKRGPFKHQRDGGSFDARAQSPGEGSRDKSANSLNSIMQVTTTTELVPVPQAQGLATPFMNLMDQRSHSHPQ